MGRQVKKCPKKCTRHYFLLKPVHYSAFFSRQSQFSYCPSNLQTQPSLPKFNRDRKDYTASFVLASDKIKLQTNDEIYRMDHQRFKQQHREQKTEIYQPKPKAKNNYCSVCKDLFQDYLEHINSIKHKKTIHQCHFNISILDLCQKFTNDQPKHIRNQFCDDLLTTFAPKILNQTSTTLQSQKEKIFQFEFDEPQLFIQKSTRQSLDGNLMLKSHKSFHSFIDNNQAKPENQFENLLQNQFLQHSIFKQLNSNLNAPQFGSFKVIQQTASPVKTRVQKPIILAGNMFRVDL